MLGQCVPKNFEGIGNELPKNANGFRTTHTCELCGFEPKTKNKYREKQDHLVMKHFKEQIDKIFPHCRPYSCPAKECPFEGKDKQALLRHYTGKHGVLEFYLKNALNERGISYHLSDSAKRKSLNNPEQHRHKMARLSPSPPGAEPGVQCTDVQTVIPPPLLPPSPEAAPDTTTILPSEFSAPPEGLVYSSAGQLPCTQPSITMAISQPPPPPPAQTQLRLPTVPTTKLPSMATLTNKTKLPVSLAVDDLIASFTSSDYSATATVFNSSQLSHEQPIGSHIVSSTTLDHLYLQGEPGAKLPLINIESNNVMWSSGSAALSTDNAQTVPHPFDSSEMLINNFDNIDYDYLYPATVDTISIVQTSTPSSASTSPTSSQNVLSFESL